MIQYDENVGSVPFQLIQVRLPFEGRYLTPAPAFVRYVAPVWKYSQESVVAVRQRSNNVPVAGEVLHLKGIEFPYHSATRREEQNGSESQGTSERCLCN